MKHQWKIRWEVPEYPDGQNRWDRAYLLVLEIAQSVEVISIQTSLEVQNANSDLRASFDPAPSPS